MVSEQVQVANRLSESKGSDTEDNSSADKFIPPDPAPPKPKQGHQQPLRNATSKQDYNPAKNPSRSPNPNVQTPKQKPLVQDETSVDGTHDPETSTIVSSTGSIIQISKNGKADSYAFQSNGDLVIGNRESLPRHFDGMQATGNSFQHNGSVLVSNASEVEAAANYFSKLRSAGWSGKEGTTG